MHSKNSISRMFCRSEKGWRAAPVKPFTKSSNRPEKLARAETPLSLSNLVLCRPRPPAAVFYKAASVRSMRSSERGTPKIKIEPISGGLMRLPVTAMRIGIIKSPSLTPSFSAVSFARFSASSCERGGSAATKSFAAARNTALQHKGAELCRQLKMFHCGAFLSVAESV